MIKKKISIVIESLTNLLVQQLSNSDNRFPKEKGLKEWLPFVSPLSEDDDLVECIEQSQLLVHLKLKHTLSFLGHLKEQYPPSEP